MTSDNLKYVLRQFVERALPVCRPRELALPMGTGKIIGLAGVRRSGKTFLFFDAIRRLAAQGVDRRRMVYLNFEDDRLQPIKTAELVVTVADGNNGPTGMVAHPRKLAPGYAFRYTFPHPGHYTLRVFPPSVASAFEIQLDVK